MFRSNSVWRRVSAGLLIVFCACGVTLAADNQVKEGDGPWRAIKPGAWVNVAQALLADLAKQNIKPSIKFTYDATPGAGVCGIITDRSLPGTWIIIHGQGVWKHTAGNAGYQRVDGGRYDGFYENAGPDIDPEGRGLCLFSIQGSTIDSTCAITRDGGKTWSALSTDQAAFGYDVGAVDWAGGGQTILAKKHHNGDLVLSHDGGRNWTVLGKAETQIQALGLIGSVLLKGVRGAQGGLMRSTDDGKNWVKVADCQFGRVGHVVLFHDTAYLTTAQGVLVSRDKGEHWVLAGEPCSGLLGPVMFGKDEKHQVVYGSKGFYESNDGGKTWALAVPFTDDAALRKGRYEYGIWDPSNDCFFVTHIAGEGFCYRRANGVPAEPVR
jgi:hypothetical protein